MLLALLGLLGLSIATLPIPSSIGGEEIYTSALATGCGLVALLLLEEQLLSRSDIRLMGLAATYLTLMALGIAWAVAANSGASVSPRAGPVLTVLSAELDWHLALGLGVALSLGTPNRLWQWISVRASGSFLSSALLVAAAALILLAAVVAAGAWGAAVLPGRAAEAPGGLRLLTYPWITVEVAAVLLALCLRRWRRLSWLQRWVLVAATGSIMGLVLGEFGADTQALGSQLNWLESGAGVLLLIGALASRLHRGDRDKLMIEIAERQLIRDIATAKGPTESLQQTADRICRQLVSSPGYAIAHVVALTGSGPAVVVASHPEPPAGYPTGQVGGLGSGRSASLRERGMRGPWIQLCSDAFQQAETPEQRDYWMGFMSSGFYGFAYAPIRRGRNLLGLLVTGIRERDPDRGADLLTAQLPLLADFALAATNCLGPLLSDPGSSSGRAETILQILEERSFHPVFQPIVDLKTRETVGYEALSRFPDGLSPDSAFAIAAEHGLSEQLEIATLRRALSDGGKLVQGGQFLALNLSPAVLVASWERIGRSLSRWPHAAVIEITEHSVIVDYAEVRSALRKLGPKVRLSVDDAGAGYASLRHILELRPHFVKLDISLVRGMSDDPVREAMVAGLQHFAERSDCVVIAEGVETSAEYERLLELKVPLGQGFLFAKPQPLAALKAAA